MKTFFFFRDHHDFRTKLVFRLRTSDNFLVISVMYYKIIIWANVTKFGQNFIDPQIFLGWYGYGDRHGLGPKPTRAILLCPWKRHYTAISPAWWSWQAVLNFSHISIKFEAGSNILASPKAGPGNCLPYVLAPPSLCRESGG